MTNPRHNWIQTTLGDMAFVNPKESLKKGALVKHVAMDCIDPFTRKVARFDFSPFRGGTKFRNGDTLMARITPCLENGKTSRVDFLEDDEVGSGSTEFLVLRKKAGTSDGTFLYYLVVSSHVRELAIKAMTGTSGRQRVQTDSFISQTLLVPQVEEQRLIAAVLSSLDDKIELLRAQNKTLEEMAQRLFKEWFVDFNFPNADGKPYKKSGGRMVESEMGEIPDGWRVDQLESIVDVKGGTTPSTKEASFWNGEHCWTSPKDLSNCKDVFLRSTEKKITTEGLSQISSGLLPVGTVLLSSRAPIGYLAIADVPVAINQGYIAIMPRKDYDNFFTYLWIKHHLDTIISAANGSTFLEISKSSFKLIELVRPPEQIVFQFRKVVQPIFDKISINEMENITLSTVRNKLLSPLLNGEIRL